MKTVIAYIALFWAIALSIASIIMPPMGEIDGSVLILIAQIIVFISTIIGITLPSSFKNIINGTTSKKNIQG